MVTFLIVAAALCGSSARSARAQGWTFDTVIGVPTAPGCSPMTVVATGLGFDPLGRPVAGWQQADGCSIGAFRPRWARKDAGAWTSAIVVNPNAAPTPYGEWADLELAPDGTPHYVHAGNSGYYIYGSSEWAAGIDVNLDLNPVGPGVVGRLIEHRQNYCAYYPAFASDFAPGASVPTMLIGTTCGGGGGWLWLDGVGALHGAPIFATPQTGSGEFRNIDYASGPAGQHHVVYFVGRGPGGRLVAYSNGTPEHEFPLADPHLGRGAEVSIAVGADNRVHVAIGGIPTCSNTYEGGLLYATSMDGVIWEKTFVDVMSGRDPSIALDGAGNPVISYHRFANEVRLARKADGEWTSERVWRHLPSTTSRRSRLAFDLSGLPNVLFRNSDSHELQIATGPSTGSGPDLTNPGDQTDAPGESVSLPIDATDLDGLALTYAATCLPPGLSINPVTGVISGTVDPTAEAGSPYSVTVTATNTDAGEAIVTFVWVIDPNSAPSVTNPGPQESEEGAVVSLAIAASDPDGDVLTFGGTGLPPGLSIDPATGVITGTVAPGTAGPYTVTVTVSDGSLSDSETFSWLVFDPNEAPSGVIVAGTPGPCVAGQSSIGLDGSGSLDPDGTIVSRSWTTDCPGGVFSDPAGASTVLTVAVTACMQTCDVLLVVTDDDGAQSAPAVQSVTFSDTAAPVLGALPGPSTIEGPATPAFATPPATDACTGSVTPTFVEVTTAGGCPQEYSVTRTWTAADGCGNSSTASQTITVEDTIAPVLSALPAASTIEGPAMPSFATPTATDACAGVLTPTFADVTTPGACPQEYSVTRTWTASDGCGNSSTASQTVTVEDTIAPVLSPLPAASTIQCPAMPSFATPTATDACAGVVTPTFADVTTPGACPQEYSVTRTWTASDGCGNSSTASQTVTVEDTIAPVLSPLPAASTIQCPAMPSFATPTATDACAGVVTPTFADVTTPGACPQEYSVTRTWTASDGCGNSSTASQSIMVLDSTPPVITCPVGLTFQCAAEVPPPSAMLATATDACGSTPVVAHVGDVIVDEIFVDRFTVERTYRATDACGNTADCVQFIVVSDTTAPVPVAMLVPLPPAAPALPQAPGSACSAPASHGFTVSGAATDNCDPTPVLGAVLVVTNHDVAAPGGPCVLRVERLAVAFGEVVEIRLVAAPCPARPPKSPRQALSMRSDGTRVFVGESVVLEVTATDRCGNAAAASHDPTVAPPPPCEDPLVDGSCCPAIQPPQPVSCPDGACP